MISLSRGRSRTPEQSVPDGLDDVAELDEVPELDDEPEPDEEPDDDGPSGPLGDDTPPEKIAAEAGRQHHAAAVASDRAAGDTAEAERIMEEARERAAQVIAEAEAGVRALSQSAGQAQREAADLEQHAKYLDTAAADITKAEEAEARADALEAEREQLTGTVADLDGKLDALMAERGQLAAQMTTARESGDLDALAAHRSRDSAAGEVIAALSAQRQAALARLEAIGDGTETFANRPLLKVLPPLAQARQAAGQARRSASTALNLAYPDRPQAVVDRLRAERAQADRYRLEQADAEAARQQATRPRTFVRL